MKRTREDEDENTLSRCKAESITLFHLGIDVLCHVLSLLITPDWLHCRIASRRFHVESKDKVEERRTIVRVQTED
jgi:hypothetical protein